LSRLRYQLASSLFSCSFIQNELGEASNIKDKNNRKNVVRVLTLIAGQLKLMNSDMIGENGLLIFFGIDRSCQEIKEVITPPTPITEFYYQCSKHFATDRFESVFSTKPIGHVVFISGVECIIYQYNGNWKKIKTINANLIKRHHKGGQSSVRFSRLAEESRTHYITHIVDWINQLIVNDQNNYVFGGRELKEMLMNSHVLKISMKTDDVYHIFNEQTIHENYFKQIMIDPSFGNDKKVEYVIELLEKDPDYLLFSADEINESINDVEYIININTDITFTDKLTILLPNNHSRYGRLKNYQIIGKMYFKRNLFA
jgi:hypothetical protein